MLRDRKASTSYVQRRLGIGYNRAASLIERMEKEGLIGAANHAGKREILVGDDEAEQTLLGLAADCQEVDQTSCSRRIPTVSAQFGTGLAPK